MRVVVTGGTGFVGSNVVKLCGEWHGDDVLALGRTAPQLQLPGAFASVDLLDGSTLSSTVRDFSPELVIHSAILNDFEQMYSNRTAAWDSYVVATRNVIDAANSVGATMVYVSTDWVFDGTSPDSDESAPPNPVNLYGFLKAAGELVTLERAHEPIVARIAGVNGLHWARHETPRSQDWGFGFFVASLVASLERGEPFTVWESNDINMRATPSLASESAEMMRRLATTGRRGVFHCCGADSVSRSELAVLAAEVFELDANLILAGPPPRSVMPPQPIPEDTSLSARSTALSIGYELPSAKQLLLELKNQLATGEVRPVAERVTRHDQG
ncbi:dTDP-4-dehydrorhamnose reductase [Marmoricola sp. URHA0025 HA25]